MKKKEITPEELEAFIVDFNNTFSDVDMDSAFYEVKSELDAILNPAKNTKE